MVGADYSQTRCVGGDGGTTVDTGGLDRILEFGENSVRAQAGVRVGTLVAGACRARTGAAVDPRNGPNLPGCGGGDHIAAAILEAGMAQLSSCVTEMKVITPQGKQMVVTERDRDLMRVLRSSFGLLGVVHEVVLRVRPISAVKIDYQVLSLKEFSSRYSSIIERRGRFAAAHLAFPRSHYRRATHAR